MIVIVVGKRCQCREKVISSTVYTHIKDANMPYSIHFIFLLCCVIISSSTNGSTNSSSYGKLGKKLLTFISITSAPSRGDLRNAIRNTWLLPCKQAHVCDYRFFIDVNSYSASQILRNESRLHGDIVFRDACPLMKRHPESINYGNSPPIKENIYLITKNVTHNEMRLLSPDYPTRRMYKIDWKMCFLQYIGQQYPSVLYHIFVEDDSYICTKNVMFQLVALQYKLRLLAKRIDEKLKRLTMDNNQDNNDNNDIWDSGYLSINATMKGELVALLDSNDSLLLVTAYDAISPHVALFDDNNNNNHTALHHALLSTFHNHTSTNFNSTSFSSLLSSLFPPFAFRTGTFMYDGFDDSSTIMNHQVASIFQTHYPSEQLHCNHVLDAIQGDWNDTLNTTNSPSLSAKSMFLSWGNSWMDRQCRWTEEIERLYHVKIRKPNWSCQMSSILDGSNVDKHGYMKTLHKHHNNQSAAAHVDNTLIELPCISHPLILHHHLASHVLLHEENAYRVAHLCEYLLLVDKVKSPEIMFELYNRTCGEQRTSLLQADRRSSTTFAATISNNSSLSRDRDYHDFSDLFLYEAKHAWNVVLEKLQEEESSCQESWMERNHTFYEDHNVKHGHNDYPCLFAAPDIRRRRRQQSTKAKTFLRYRLSAKMKDLSVISFNDYFDQEYIMKEIS